jgi:hypothetical protein
VLGRLARGTVSILSTLYAFSMTLSTGFRIFLVSALCGFTSVAAAQTETTVSAPSKWYAGIKGAFEVRSFSLEGADTGGTLYTGTFYGGYQVTPKLAVQAGVLYGRGKLNQDQQHTVWGLPVQLRIGLSRPQRPFQVDGVLEAAAVVVERKELQYSYPTSPQTFTLPYQRGVNGLLSAGLGFRYLPGKQLQVHSDLLAGTNVHRGLANYYGFNLGFSAALGLRYHFN